MAVKYPKIENGIYFPEPEDLAGMLVYKFSFLRHPLKENGISIKEFAKCLGYNPSTVCDYLAGKRRASIKTIKKFVKGFYTILEEKARRQGEKLEELCELLEERTYELAGHIILSENPSFVMKELRNYLGKKLEDIAEDLEITPQTLYYYECGQKEPRVSTFRKWFKALIPKSKVDELLKVIVSS